MPSVNEENINKVNQYNQKSDELKERVNDAAKNYTGIRRDYDKTRYTNKMMLKELVAAWRKEAAEILENDKKLSSILKQVEEYADRDITASHAFRFSENENKEDIPDLSKDTSKEWGYFKHRHHYISESKLFDSILKNLNSYYDEQLNSFDEYITESQDVEDLQKEEDENAKNLSMRMAINLMMYFEGQRDGHLDINDSKMDKEDFIINEPQFITTKKVKDAHYSIVSDPYTYNMKKQPLFPHDPSPQDIAQVYLGDCYLDASLSSIAAINPQKIREMMRDNGDGTVTVRFFSKVSPQEHGISKNPYYMYKPVYVTVDKMTPSFFGSQRSLWVSAIERAYAASGLATHRGYNSRDINSPVPDNLDELYEKYKKMPEHLRPTRVDCPWLFDDNNKLKKWEPSYDDLDGGNSNDFFEHILGPECIPTSKITTDFSGIVDKTANNLFEEHLLRLIEKKTSKEFTDNITKNIVEVKKQLYPNMLTSILAAVYDPDLNFDWKNYKINVSRNQKEVLLDIPVSPYANLVNEYINNAERSTYSKSEKQMFFKNFKKLTEDFFNSKQEVDEKQRVFLDALKTEVDADKYNIEKEVYYSSKEQALYNYISESLQNSEAICCSSFKAPNDKGGRIYIDGIACNHVYTLLGIKEEVKNGRPYKFVIIRNPHSLGIIPTYDFSTDPPKIDSMEHNDSEGVFAVELSHFMKSFEEIHHGTAYKPNLFTEEQLTQFVSKETTSKYIRLMDSMISETNKYIQADKNRKNIEIIGTAYRSIININKIIENNVENSYSNITESYNELKGVFRDAVKENPSFAPLKEHVENILKMYTSGVKDPLAEYLKQTSAPTLAREKPLPEILLRSNRWHLGDGAVTGQKELRDAAKKISDADPVYISSSNEFRTIKKALVTINNNLDDLQKDGNETNFKNYIKNLDDLEKHCTDYLSFKIKQKNLDESGLLSGKNETEQKRIDAVRSVMTYAIEKKNAMAKSYASMKMAQAIIKSGSETSNDVAVDGNEVRTMIESSAFKKFLEKTSNEKLMDLSSNNVEECRKIYDELNTGAEKQSDEISNEDIDFHK